MSKAFAVDLVENYGAGRVWIRINRRGKAPASFAFTFGADRVPTHARYSQSLGAIIRRDSVTLESRYRATRGALGAAFRAAHTEWKRSLERELPRLPYPYA